MIFGFSSGGQRAAVNDLLCAVVGGIETVGIPSCHQSSVPCHISHSPPRRYPISRANCHLISLSAITAVNSDNYACWQAGTGSKVFGICLYLTRFYTVLCWKLSAVESRLSELINDRGGSDNWIKFLFTNKTLLQRYYNVMYYKR
jgi:hypothetical protein